MTIRKAELGDYDGICQLIRAADDLHAEILPGFFRKARQGNPRTRDEVRRILESPTETILVREEGGVIAGLVHVQIYDTPPVAVMVARRRAHIDLLVVAEAARRRGLGRTLLDGARAWARGMGAEELLLTVWAGNDLAQRFYEKQGFRRINTVLGQPL